ncbi:MAG: hypothetical protein HOB33_10765 [Bacteroidetes Order II. Incertae sedis bacterium]|nr:hypothetical protein [Bacteroidetes Order II. bacterium]MBT6199676.1 hypothetical protein [Bacteroidetes Order II. bacterium]MBT6425537.1 hypothetical protein [Bacteroidetes Order II. bacterium]MBT6599529.1 hypothetical protein [Bacteroidetes Order II. bacterium]
MIKISTVLAVLGMLVVAGDSGMVMAQTDSLRTTTTRATVSRIQSRGIYVQHNGVDWVRGDTLSLVSAARGKARVRVAGKASDTLLLAWLDTGLNLSIDEIVELVGPRRDPEVLTAPVLVEADERVSILDGVGTQVRPSTIKPIRISGTLSSSLTASHANLAGRFTTNRSSSRTYATPVSSLRVRVEGLPGQTHILFNVRGSRRFSSDQIVGQAGSLRAYEMKVVRSPSSSQVRFEAGRFRERHTPSGGYLDGASAAFVSGGATIGVAAGFEPERYNQSFQTSLYKVAAFADWSTRHSGGSTSLSTSFMRIDGDNLASPFSLVSVDQKSRLGGLRLSTSLQLDHAPGVNTWNVSRLYVRASTELTEAISINGRYGQRKYFKYWLPDSRFSSTKEQVSVGIQFNRAPHFLSVSLSSNAYSGSERSHSFNTSFRTQPKWLPFAFRNASNIWMRANNTTYYNSSSFQREVKGVLLGLEYALLAVDMVGPRTFSHIAGLSARFSFKKWGYFSVRERTHIGSSLTSSTVYLNYGIRF